MACMKLGSKPDLFQLEGQSWLCNSGLPSDVCVQVGEISFHLHKFPLLSRSKLADKIVEEKEEETRCVWSLDVPGGAGSFLLVAKFCYDVKFELTATNVVSLRCASEHLQMNDEFGEGNLISQTSHFLDQVLNNWVDTLQALETCEAVSPLSEDLDIVSRCIDSLAAKACDDRAPQSPSEGDPEDWWHGYAAILSLPLFKRLIHALTCKGMLPDKISACVMFYSRRHLPFFYNQESTNPAPSDVELVEEMIKLLPDRKGSTPTDFLLKLLQISIMSNASPPCRESLERLIGAQLEQAALQDLLILNTCSSTETEYDVECVQRIVDHFLDLVQDDEYGVEEERSGEGSEGAAPALTVVASLLDGYMAEIASDVNLKLEDFVLLASSFPEYARSLDDGIYKAIDVYLKAHPWLTEAERELVCRLMNCQKLSLEASTNAAQNEMLPLRVTMQVLFFEQLRLRSYMAGWFVVAGGLENPQNPGDNMPQMNTNATLNDVRERVARIEKKCDNMRHEIRKLVRTKGRWVNFYKRFGLKVKTNSFDLESTNSPPDED